MKFNRYDTIVMRKILDTSIDNWSFTYKEFINLQKMDPHFHGNDKEKDYEI
ncbi:MAG TPA: hypothetical protein VGK25_13110 [Ignavibacteria bacterium]